MTKTSLERRLREVEGQLDALLTRQLASSPWIRLREVCDSTGMSRWTIWRKVKAGAFPAPCKPYPNVERWSLEEVEAWKRTQLEDRCSMASLEDESLAERLSASRGLDSPS